MVKLYQHQIDAIEQAKNHCRVAFYHDMGLGKTFTGSEKMIKLAAPVNLIVCQKSKINDWLDHFKTVYGFTDVYNLTKPKEMQAFFDRIEQRKRYTIGVINYDLLYRRPQLKELSDFTLLLDESSIIQNEQTDRAKFILAMKPENVILLSGTPTGGRYERLWSQMRLLGWEISKKTFYNQYVNYHFDDVLGFKRMVIDGYKNEDRLRRKMKKYGCQFLKSEDVFNLPDQNFQNIVVKTSKDYKKFKKDGYLVIGDIELIGDTTLNKMLRERQLCGQYSEEKLQAFSDILESTDDRIVVFYNFTDEFRMLAEIARDHSRPFGRISGEEKYRDDFDRNDDGLLFVQYQAGAMGLNLQIANRIVYFTPPLSSELFEQSKKRIHRINQTKTCFYYQLVCKGSIEERIYKTLAERRDYTNALFEMETIQ